MSVPNMTAAIPAPRTIELQAVTIELQAGTIELQAGTI
jgi:hypothetical protein